MPLCKYCTHFKPVYSPVLHRQIKTCELPDHNPGCEGQFEKAYEDTGKPKAFIKRR